MPTAERPLGLVLSRGYLNRGQEALARRARDDARSALLCIFLNQRQFGPGEEYALYPRDAERDLALAEAGGFDVLWLPTEQDIYPKGFMTEVRAAPIEGALQSVVRPEVLRAHLTSVLRVLGMTGARAVYYGERDLHKAAVLRLVLRDLAMDVEVSEVPTVREEDGLSLGAMNTRLRTEERGNAPRLYAALQEAQELFSCHGEVDATRLLGRTSAALTRIPGFRLQYVLLMDPVTLTERQHAAPGDLLLAGGSFGRTRLRDVVRLPARA